MPRSLSTKLIAAFAFIIFVCLFSAGTAFVLFLRDSEVEQARERVGRLAEPLALQVTYLEWVGLSVDDMTSVLKSYAERFDIRLLLVDKATSRVVFDTEDRLEGAIVDAFNTATAGTERVGPIYVWQIRFSENGTNLLLFTPLDTTAGGERPSPTILSSYRTVVAVPEEDITSAWLDVLPRLAVAGGIALVISIALALLLSRSISGRLAQITRASEEMARGRYDQQIEARGRDEVGRLATAFNTMAKEVDRSQSALRQFLADASHELRTPLTSIQGFSQAMVDGAIDTPEGLADAARIINDEAQRMRTLVDELLELSRIEAGQAALQIEPLQLEELLQATLERFRRRAEEKGIEMRLQVNDLPRCEGDGRALEQVFSNLVDNAVRHTPDDGLISVEAKVVNGSVRVSVRNSGSLIPPEHLPHLFERFYQVNGSGADEGHTGLGLAIASEVVQAHGGEITVTSSQQEGTEFTVALPLSRKQL